MSPALPRHLDPAPPPGTLPARAAFPSSAPRLSLDGDWRFRLEGAPPHEPEPAVRHRRRPSATDQHSTDRLSTDDLSANQLSTCTLPTGQLAFGEGAFDVHTGRLRSLGGTELAGPVLDIWRAMTDNDREPGAELRGSEAARTWRQRGLDRMRHRTDRVCADGPDLTVHSRLAPASEQFGLLATYHWSAVPGGLRLRLTAAPDGPWPEDMPLPRIGVRLALPASWSLVRWFGLGPGESYPNSRAAVRVGRWEHTVDALQFPYTFPQENGHRSEVRWAELTPSDGAAGGIRFEGRPHFGFTARRWTSQDLDTARHPHELVARDRVHVHLDLAQHGLGSASCGPDTLPAHRLTAAPMEFAVVLRATP
ncbi:beta-galactosidase small subunit [Streptomyces sp. NPDC102274]|uniref:beta-galactosidase small subunit n=1 Tax=Streptomyces sp. NPDC102274 TaxID=3366151 RepID=UPI0038132055